MSVCVFMCVSSSERESDRVMVASETRLVNDDSVP